MESHALEGCRMGEERGKVKVLNFYFQPFSSKGWSPNGGGVKQHCTREAAGGILNLQF